MILLVIMLVIFTSGVISRAHFLLSATRNHYKTFYQPNHESNFDHESSVNLPRNCYERSYSLLNLREMQLRDPHLSRV